MKKLKEKKKQGRKKKARERRKMGRESVRKRKKNLPPILFVALRTSKSSAGKCV